MKPPSEAPERKSLFGFSRLAPFAACACDGAVLESAARSRARTSSSTSWRASTRGSIDQM